MFCTRGPYYSIAFRRASRSFTTILKNTPVFGGWHFTHLHRNTNVRQMPTAISQPRALESLEFVYPSSSSGCRKVHLRYSRAPLSLPPLSWELSIETGRLSCSVLFLRSGNIALQLILTTRTMWSEICLLNRTVYCRF